MLPCSRRMKDEITAPLLRSVIEFLAEQENVSAEDLRNRFGTPEVIAASSLEDADTTEILRRLRVKRKLTAIVVAAVIMALLSWGGYLAYSNYKLENQFFSATHDPLVVEVVDQVISSETTSP